MTGSKKKNTKPLRLTIFDYKKLKNQGASPVKFRLN